MNWNGEEYSRRLRSYSDDTILLLSQCDDRETFFKSTDIVMETDSEEEVRTKLKALLEEKKKRPPVKIPTTEEEWEEIDRQAWEEYLRSKQN